MDNELVSHQNNNAAAIMETFAQNEQLADPVTRRDFFAQLDGNGFVDLVQQTASLVRTGNPNERQHFDGDTVGLMGHEVPDQRDKEQLLRESWGVARSFLEDPKISDQDALDYAALTVAGGLLYAHPFADGNGRTSRSLSYVISRGASNPEELQSILDKSSGGGNWEVAPVALITESEYILGGNQPQNIEWEDSFAGEAEDALGGIIANSRYKNIILRRFISENSEHVLTQLEESTGKNNDGESVLNAEAFIERLVNDHEAGMTNAQDLLRIHNEVRADYVRRYLRAMQSTTPVQLHGSIKKVIGSQGPLLEAKRKIMSKEVAARGVSGELTPRDQQLVHHIGFSSLRR